MKALLLFLCFTISGLNTTLLAQDHFEADTYPIVNPLLIQQFHLSKCADTIRWQLEEPTPDWLRISLRGYYAAHNNYPFMITFQPIEKAEAKVSSPQWQEALKVNGPLYFIYKGICRGPHVSIPLSWAGTYYLVILDQEKPSLLRIETDLQTTSIQFQYACSLHY